MAEEMSTQIADTSQDAAVIRIYEVGYHIVSAVPEENVEKVVVSKENVEGNSKPLYIYSEAKKTETKSA